MKLPRWLRHRPRRTTVIIDIPGARTEQRWFDDVPEGRGDVATAHRVGVLVAEAIDTILQTRKDLAIAQAAVWLLRNRSQPAADGQLAALHVQLASVAMDILNHHNRHDRKPFSGHTTQEGIAPCEAP